MTNSIVFAQKIFLLGEIVAYSGFGYALLIVLFGSLNYKEYERQSSIGKYVCFLGIFIMMGALFYGLLGAPT